MRSAQNGTSESCWIWLLTKIRRIRKNAKTLRLKHLQLPDVSRNTVLSAEGRTERINKTQITESRIKCGNPMTNECAKLLRFLVGKSKALWQFVITDTEELFSYYFKLKLRIPSLNTTDAAQKHTPHIRTQNWQNIQACLKENKPQWKLIYDRKLVLSCHFSLSPRHVGFHNAGATDYKRLHTKTGETETQMHRWRQRKQAIQ
jgi:hypothetical protein